MVDVTKEEYDLFEAINDDIKCSTAVVGCFDYAYKKGFRDGKKIGVDSVKADYSLGYVISFLLGFLSFLCIYVFWLT